MCDTQWPRADVEKHKIALAAVTEETESDIMSELEEAVGYCPNCILTTILQSKLPMVPHTIWKFEGEEEGEHRFRLKWDYKAKLREWWENKNTASELC